MWKRTLVSVGMLLLADALRNTGLPIKGGCLAVVGVLTRLACLGICAVSGCTESRLPEREDLTRPAPAHSKDPTKLRPYVATKPVLVPADKIQNALALFRGGSQAYRIDCRFDGAGEGIGESQSSEGVDQMLEQLRKGVAKSQDYTAMIQTVGSFRDRDRRLRGHNPRSVTVVPFSSPSLHEIQEILGASHSTSKAFWRLGEEPWGVLDYDAGGCRPLILHRYDWIEFGIVDERCVVLRLDFANRVTGDLSAWSVWTVKETLASNRE